MKTQPSPRSYYPTAWPKSNKLPAGAYHAIVNYASYKFIDDRGYGRVYMTFRITEGEFDGATEFKNYTLSSPQASRHLETEFKKFGVLVMKPEDYPCACEEMMGQSVTLSIHYAQDGKKSVFLSLPSKVSQ